MMLKDRSISESNQRTSGQKSPRVHSAMAASSRGHGNDRRILTADITRRRCRRVMFIIFALVLLLVLMIGCSALGVTEGNLLTVCRAVTCGILGNEPTETAQKVILHLRLPRIVLGALVGIGLSGAGVVMQGLTRNPLVSPFTIGISSAAAFGASVAIVFGFSFWGFSETGVVSNAFLVALVCALVVFLLAQRLSLSVEGFVLTGIALNYFFEACGAGIRFVADEAKLAEVVAWSFGSLNGGSWKEVSIVLAVVVCCGILLMLMHRPLSLMAALDDDIVRTMGVHPGFIRLVAIALSVLMTAASISFTGIIGFVGLAAPHIARNMVGSQYATLLPMSGLVGGILVVLSDTIGRMLLSPIIIPVGIIISFVGVPIFVHQIIATRRQSI